MIISKIEFSAQGDMLWSINGIGEFPMYQDANIIVRIAHHMLAKHRGDALCCAELRANNLREEPRAAARWHRVADAIGILIADKVKPRSLNARCVCFLIPPASGRDEESPNK